MPPNDTNRLDEKNFSRAVVRRLPAEVLLDAVQQATGPSKEVALATTTEGLAERAIGPKAGAGSNLRRGGGDFASKVFGRSARDDCDCSASNEPNLLQSIYLQNDSEIATALDRPGGWVEERTGANSLPPSKIVLKPKPHRQPQAADQRAGETSRRLPEGGKDKAIADMKLQIAARRDDLKAAETQVSPACPSSTRRRRSSPPPWFAKPSSAP